MTTLKQQLRIWKAAVVTATLILAQFSNAAEQDTVKAAFLLNFAKFAEWPDGKLSAGLQICALSFQPLAGALNDLNGREVQGQIIKITTGVTDAQLNLCNVLYVSIDDEARLAKLQDTLKKHPILVVGESNSILDTGGMISLKQQSGRFRFDINLLSVRTVGLNLSSQLLHLANEVRQ